MRRIWLICIGFVIAASMVLGSEKSTRFLRKAVIPGGSRIVVVAEGEFEPRSVGSYSLRAYAGTNPRFPYDDFIVGTVRPRNGMVEDVRFSDVDRDGSPEIIVVIRSVGTGGYLSADTFQLHGTVLTLLETVAGLSKNADPIRALEAKLTNRTEPLVAPDANKPHR